VFISSTFADLQEERKEVMEAIINLNCFPAGMEMFPAADIEQFDYIKTIIDESDYYVLVLAGRYGSLAADGKSYTEKEYEYAKEKGIPVLVFVKEDIDNIPAKQADNNPELKEKLIAFRNNAMTNRLAKFWNEKMELKYHVNDSLSKAFKLTPRTGWVKADDIVDTKTLKVLEEVRSENASLRKENSVLKEQLVQKKVIEDIADLDDITTINYSYNNGFRSQTYSNSLEISWKKLFGLIASDFITSSNTSNAKSIISRSIKQYINHNGLSFEINHYDFNTIKIQFDTLGLIKSFNAKATNGAYIEFMQITDKGKNLLREIRVVRKEKEPINS
jgi:hypothetical protein